MYNKFGIALFCLTSYMLRHDHFMSSCNKSNSNNNIGIIAYILIASLQALYYLHLLV
jgi:hypothetical protein